MSKLKKTIKPMMKLQALPENTHGFTISAVYLKRMNVETTSLLKGNMKNSQGFFVQNDVNKMTEEIM